MRTILALWLAPSTFFWTWHLLASSDIVFARDFHDRVFALYGQLLGIQPEAVPALFGKAVITDGLLVFAILLFRRRKAVAACVRNLLTRRFDFTGAKAPAGPAHPAG